MFSKVVHRHLKQCAYRQWSWLPADMSKPIPTSCCGIIPIISGFIMPIPMFAPGGGPAPRSSGDPGTSAVVRTHQCSNCLYTWCRLHRLVLEHGLPCMFGIGGIPARPCKEAEPVKVCFAAGPARRSAVAQLWC